MVYSTLLFALAILCVVWGIISAMVITAFISSRGIKINLLFFRILILKYISQYHNITKEEQGRPGFWFYSYIISMNAALVCAIVGFVLRAG